MNRSALLAELDGPIGPKRDDLLAQMKAAAEDQAKEDGSGAKSAKAQHKDPMRLARWAGLLGGSIADAESTRRALDRPDVYEANPLLKGIAKNTPALYGVKLGTNAALAAVLDKAHKTHPKTANTMAAALSALQLLVALRNTKQGKR